MITLNRDDYGLGVQQIEVPGATGFGHTGMLKTYTSLLLYLPKQNVTLALAGQPHRTSTSAACWPRGRPDGPSLLELVGVKRPDRHPRPRRTAGPTRRSRRLSRRTGCRG